MSIDRCITVLLVYTNIQCSPEALKAGQEQEPEEPEHSKDNSMPVGPLGGFNIPDDLAKSIHTQRCSWRA